MNLQYFPMDHQLCYLEIESFGFTMSDIRYEWHEEKILKSQGKTSVRISSNVSLPEFSLIGHTQKLFEAQFSTGICWVLLKTYLTILNSL